MAGHAIGQPLSDNVMVIGTKGLPSPSSPGACFSFGCSWHGGTVGDEVHLYYSLVGDELFNKTVVRPLSVHQCTSTTVLHTTPAMFISELLAQTRPLHGPRFFSLEDPEPSSDKSSPFRRYPRDTLGQVHVHGTPYRWSGGLEQILSLRRLFWRQYCVSVFSIKTRSRHGQCL
jgi:hypothetical protein